MSLTKKFTGTTFDVMIRDQFANQNRNNATLTRFIQTKQVTTREDFTDLLKDTPLLYKKGLLQLKPLIYLLIAKSPVEIKS